MRHTLACVAAVPLSLVALAGWAGDSTSESAAASAAAQRQGETREFAVDPVHTSVLFRIRHAGVANFYGRFDGFEGTVNFDADNFTNSSVAFEVQIDSVNTGNARRDGHLENADFFNARQFPTASFRSTAIRSADNHTYEMDGELTFFGQTKPITAVVRDVSTGSAQGADAVGLEAEFTLKRSDWGMTKYMADDGSDNGGLGNTVTVIVAIEAKAE